MNKRCFLSIDFEDFSFDYKRKYKITNDNLRKSELDKAYNKINEFCINYLDNNKITFFCTGIIAKKYPDIIKRISDDGHEIGCHYFYHDLIYKHDLKTFEKNIVKAKKYLEDVSSQKVRGFRAPYFGIRNSDFDHYKILEKYFEYDSTLNFSSKFQLDEFKRKSKIDRMSLFPVYSNKFFNLLPYKSGGTFLKIYPNNIILKSLKITEKNGLYPIVYLHPYEFLDDMSFFVPYYQFNELNFIKKFFIYFRQYQWHYLGNSSVIPKLKKIFNYYSSGGKMSSLID